MVSPVSLSRVRAPIMSSTKQNMKEYLWLSQLGSCIPCHARSTVERYMESMRASAKAPSPIFWRKRTLEFKKNRGRVIMVRTPQYTTGAPSGRQVS